MEKTILNVAGMSCSHCETAVKNALGEISGVHIASVDLCAKTVAVEYEAEKTNLDAIKSAIEDQGYDIIG